MQYVLQEKTVASLWLGLESFCMSKDLTSKIHIGSLMYDVVCSHPDLCGALSVISRFIANPCDEIFLWYF